MPFSVELVHGTRSWDVKVAETCSFGQLKAAAADLVGVPPEGLNMIFRGRPRSDGDLLVDAGVRPGLKITAAETADWRRSRGEDASLARARAEARAAAEEEEEAAGSWRQQQREQPSSHPNASRPPNPPPPSAEEQQQQHPAAKALDAVESTLATLEAEASAAGLLSSYGGGGEQKQQQAASEAPRTATRSGGVAGFLFSRYQQQQPAPPAAAANSNAASLKEAIRIGELATQSLLKLDAIDLPHVEEGEEEQVKGEQEDERRRRESRREQALALRPRRKLLVKRAQALGDAMDRVKERLS